MAVSMIAYSMASSKNFLILLGKLCYLAAQTKKCGPGTILFQHIQYPGCNIRGGSVIEGQIQLFLICMTIPGYLRDDCFCQSVKIQGYLLSNR